jgi:uncharacterized protein YuzE
MALIEPLEYVKLLPLVRQAPQPLNTSYDVDGDVLYVSFGPPRPATDSDFSDDDIIVRYNGEEIIGYTILHASKRAASVTP